jgi:pyruvate dehydrogenase E1 component
VIIEEGIRRMYKDGESIFYYLTVMNEQYEMLPMPEGSREGILKGMYKLRASSKTKTKAKASAQLLGSGAILNEVLKAQQVLEEKYGVAADVWSVTSYQELYREGHAADRWNRLHPGDKPRVPYVTQCLAGTDGCIVAASDYVKALPDSIDRWTGRRVTALGTDGFGRSEGRTALRDFFEVDAKHIVLATLGDLARDARIEPAVVQKAIKDLGINPDKPNPAIS